MIGLILAGTMVLTPTGREYIQPMGGNSYNIWSNDGITQVRDFNGWTEIKAPNGDTTTIWPDRGGMDVLPVIPINENDVGDPE